MAIAGAGRFLIRYLCDAAGPLPGAQGKTVIKRDGVLFLRKRAVAVFLFTTGMAAAFAAETSSLRPDALFPTQRVTFVPEETLEPLVNPYTGLAADARIEDAVRPFRLVHANITWRELEPEPGRYAFEEVERRLQFAEWRARGAHAVLRIVLDYPGDSFHLDIPDWLYQRINRQGVRYDTEYGRGFSPDYRNETLIREHERLIRAVAGRYARDPFIAFVQLGSVGHWGEWHTHETIRQRVPFPARPVSDRYIEAYVQAFGDAKPLLMRRPFALAKTYGMGLYNDAFGDPEQTDEFVDWFTNGYTSWLTGEKEPAMPDFWTKAPSGGEFPHETRFIENDRIDDTIRQAKMTHISWIGPNGPVRLPYGSPLEANLERLLRTIGYRFVVVAGTWRESVRPGDMLDVEMRVANRGAAPFYFRWPVELSLEGGDGRAVRTETAADVRTWLPGEHVFSARVSVPADWPAGEYAVTLAILDPATRQPAVRFANTAATPDGRVRVGFVRVEAQ